MVEVGHPTGHKERQMVAKFTMAQGFSWSVSDLASATRPLETRYSRMDAETRLAIEQASANVGGPRAWALRGVSLA